jgi:hypothetical protein
MIRVTHYDRKLPEAALEKHSSIGKAPREKADTSESGIHPGDR